MSLHTCSIWVASWSNFQLPEFLRWNVLQIVAKKVYLKHHTLFISVLIFCHNLHAATLIYPMAKLHWLPQFCLSLLELSCLTKLVDASHSNMGSSLWPLWLVQCWTFYIEYISSFFLWITIVLSFPTWSSSGGFLDYTSPWWPICYDSAGHLWAAWLALGPSIQLYFFGWCLMPWITSEWGVTDTSAFSIHIYESHTNSLIWKFQLLISDQWYLFRSYVNLIITFISYRVPLKYFCQDILILKWSTSHQPNYQPQLLWV